ncbi:F-box protein JMJ22 [Cladobotryum mycophilum]|uniref:F-box protein JMJ22 n=1 Tax=Cladobotryum mycophilum TaxID=491253 RepID=A0ABR0SEU0_9HYPO
MQQSDSIPTHPLGVKPLGNQYLSDGPIARRSIGTWAVLPDEMLNVILEQFDKDAILKLGSTCKFFYAFCHSDELWKSLYLQSELKNNQTIKWQRSWRSTVMGLPEDKEAKVDCSQVFSDVLHRPFACSNIVLSYYATRIPKANQIHRFDNLSYDEYAERWTEKPFILTKCIQDWPVYSQWTIDSILKDYADVAFRAEAVDWSFSRYCDYMNNNKDESPLYLFDRKFAEKMGVKVGHDADAAYWRPNCFGPDLFEVLGDERPAHRWLIIGPERSGSTFHKDPNGTSAWNAVIQGSKYWIMFPPATQVPGVYVSQDSSEVTSPLSIAEWLLTFHEEARQLPECVEGICNTGEILHVPSGWWHLVVNLENGIALTQNFVPQSPSLNLVSEVLAFLRDRPNQVTGFSRDVENPFELFTERLKQDYPDVLERGLELADKKTGKKRKWDTAVGRDEEQQGEVSVSVSGSGAMMRKRFLDGIDLDDFKEASSTSLLPTEPPRSSVLSNGPDWAETRRAAIFASTMNCVYA